MGLLGFGIAVPLLYYGVQVVAAPFYSGFSFLSTTASELGSDGSTRPSIFNAGAILVGISSFIAAVGFLRALLKLGANPILAWLTSIAVAATGVSSLWAGISRSLTPGMADTPRCYSPCSCCHSSWLRHSGHSALPDRSKPTSPRQSACFW